MEMIINKKFIRKTWSLLLYLVVLCNYMLVMACSNTSTIKKPLNVIVVLIDDMGYGDIAVLGNPIVKTPNFDAFHNKSISFSNFGVSPTCAPSRCAILTGKHEFLSSVTHTIKPMRNMSLESTTIADLFKAKGYETGLFGKWHLGQSEEYGPWARGFNKTLVVPDDMQNTHYNPKLLKNQVEIKTKGYRTDIIFDEAMNFIEDNKEQPFFCYLATYTPHAPCVVPDKYTDPYNQYTKKMGSKRYKPEFNGMIANVDENLGRLMDKVKAAGLEENTLIVVLGDNGGTFGVDTFNDGRRGVKATVWSGGIRTFSFWKFGDNFVPGETSEMARHIDILPTLAEFCNLKIPNKTQNQLEGNSLKKLLEGKTNKLKDDRMQVHHVGRWQDPTKWKSHKYANACVRWKQYTLVRIEPCHDPNCKTCRMIWEREEGRPMLYTSNKEHHRMTKPGQWELFDIETDSYQSKNIANKHPDIVVKMSEHYESWWKKVENQLSK
ncbi:sulfatase-like hydrolase/transferase [Lutibacter citreus]|uniref:sulfatase-like hydrolase/transferase n=1 Tax=Lutibacter citreus TaxID=2138210 RepID=UPI000DBE3496|nr:sulfatase-like hydrolase/transferase [Lutibacter citreus]